MKKLAYILRQLMDEHELSVSELSRRTNIGQPVIHRVASGETGDPKASTLSGLASYFGVSISQLIGDDPLPKNRKTVGKGAFRFGWSKVPLLSWEDVLHWPANRADFTELEYLLTDAEIGPDGYALKVKDTAMRPLFPENTILIIEPDFTPEDRDYVIVHCDAQKQAVFRQILYDGQEMHLKPLNTDFKIAPLEKKHKFLGVLVQSRGDFKR